MRVVVIFLAMAVAAGLIPAAQCVVTCAEPAGIPPCHRSSGKQTPTPRGSCDSMMMAGESAVLRPAEVGVYTSQTAILADVAGLIIPSASPLELASFRHIRPVPRDAHHLVLRL